MIYLTGYFYLSHYESAGCNQHGERFKRKSSKQIVTVKLSCKRNNASDLEDLIILGHTLNVPVHYDFKEGRACIAIQSAEAVREAT